MIRKFYNYYLSPYRTFVRALTPILGFVPRYLPFYQRAFMHRSGDDNDNKYQLNNERLEFLGDAILDAATAEYLFKKYPAQDEGFLTQMRSKLVNRKTLNRVAEQMDLDTFLRQHGVSNISPTMLGNALEALLGAVYLDVGYERTRVVIYRLLRQYVDVHELEATNDNYKSILLEYCQKQHKQLQYDVVKQYRAKNNRERFQIAVLIDKQQLAIAEDYNKKSAEQIAAQRALEKLGILSNQDGSIAPDALPDATPPALE